MSGRHSEFVCQGCGHVAPAWTGRCPGCGEWNTLVETLRRKPRAAARGSASATASGSARRPIPLNEVEAPAVDRLRTGIAELDRVLSRYLAAYAAVRLYVASSKRQTPRPTPRAGGEFAAPRLSDPTKTRTSSATILLRRFCPAHELCARTRG